MNANERKFRLIGSGLEPAGMFAFIRVHLRSNHAIIALALACSLPGCKKPFGQDISPVPIERVTQMPPVD